MKRRYAILDVFTDTALTGNPLAVVRDSEGLDDERMQQIAAEFNLSETVFVLPPENPIHSLKARIFTPRREMQFAGHPTVGTAVLHALDRAKEIGGQREMVVLLEENVGPVRCGVFLQGENRAHGIFDLPVLPKSVERTFDRDAVAGALGLTGAEIGFENHVPSAFDAGVEYCMVPVRDPDVLAKVTQHQNLWAAAFGDLTSGVYVYCRLAPHYESDFRARMFAPGLGFKEDPATGSAAASFAGAIMRFDEFRVGQHRFVIEQGVEMGRRSEIVLEMDIVSGAIEAARIGGDAVLIAEGEIDV